MEFAEYLSHLRSEVDGDAFFRLLKSQLKAGHRVQRVTFVPAEGKQPPRYRFLLARLGTLTTVDVPAGGWAVERFLVETRQKLDSYEDEVRRCELLLRRAVEAVARVLGKDAAQQALLSVSRQVGAGASASPPRVSVNLTTSTKLATEQLRRELDATARELYAERDHPLDEAGRIVNETLARLTVTA